MRDRLQTMAVKAAEILAKFAWMPAIILFSLDQLTKQLVMYFLALGEVKPIFHGFNLLLAYNRGAAFSLLAHYPGWQQWFLIFVAVVVCLGILVWYKHVKPNVRIERWALVLIFAGALGNAIDRLIYGHVIDFIDLYYEHLHWYTFNLADTYITVGVILLLWQQIKVLRT